MSTDKKMTLKGPEAITLWKQGKEAWNQWVKEHPEADIDFSRVAFGRYRYDRNCQISADAWPFAGFQFPKGEVNFSGAEFGNGNVNFVEAQFGDGNVNFFEAQFGDGTVSFSGAEFGNGNVNFVEAQFGDGNVSFIDARFGKGTVSFSDARFGNGTVDFWNARFGDGAVRFGGADFGDGDVRFEGARFGKGTVSFSDAEFGEGNVNFFEAQFGDGTVSFSGAEFGNGNVNFWNARFGEGTVNFWNARFGDGAVSFDSVKFEGPAGFSHLTQASSAFSFRNAHFGQSLTLSSKNHFTCVPDFINTHMGHHMSLRGVHLLPQLKTGPEDIGRFCRLKELAEGQKDHERALEFKAQEILATRQHQNKGLAKILPWCFEKGSNYGRSVLRPLVGLTGVWLVFGFLYSSLSAWCSQSITAFYGQLWNGLAFSASQMFSLVPGFRESREAALKALFPGMPPDVLSLPGGFSALTFFQGLLAMALLFLLGLALRNRFRL